jgi:Signal transduction histidine kinase
MTKLIPIIKKFLDTQLDFRVRLFNVLAMAGTVISFFITITAVFVNAGIVNILTGVLSTVVSFLLLYYSYRSGRYQLCYMIVIIVIFLILFPIFFFSAGGYHSGMPTFFVFAVAFTVFMLEGKKGFIMSAVELVIYIIICVIAKLYPQTVNWYKTDTDILVDIIISFVIVSLSLGITLFLHFRLYNQQQKELVTAREEAIRFSNAKSNFLANMSHEIRTPINVILGMNEMILRETDSEYIKNYSLNIQNAGKTLLLLINNVLDVSRIESGKLSIAEEDYSTFELTNELSVTGLELTGKYGLTFKCEIDETLPSVLTGDFIHIKQIVTNFLSNAAKYTKHGGVTLSFDQIIDDNLNDNDSNKILFRITVADTGIGIKPEKIPFLFDAFVRADMPSNKYIEGTGLGLAITKQLTELMEGYINIESVWGEGSVFSVVIPQKVRDNVPFVNRSSFDIQKEKPRDNSFIAPGGTVLLVDDNKENLQVLKLLLSNTMLRTDTAESGLECLRAVENSNYDAILMDYMMPDMDGIDILRKLKKIKGFNIPVLALTANVGVGVKQRLLDEGFSAYISKPIMWRELESALISFLPENLVILNMSESCDVISHEEKNLLTTELARSGIVLDEGLRYLSGNIIQYKKLVEFFIENFESNENEVIQLVKKKDWLNLKFRVHSLKSKARAVGAINLSNTAAKLEMQCTANNEIYIEAILPTLYYEWRLVFNSLTEFADRFNNVLTNKENETSFALDELFPLLKHNRLTEAIEVLDGLIAFSDSEEIKLRLKEIKTKVKEVEFREAERLAKLLGGKAYE